MKSKLTHTHAKFIVFVTILMVFSLAIFSCDKEEANSELQNSSKPENSSVINGRLFFLSKNDLKKSIQELKKVDIKVVENKFEKLYNEGFISHSPILSPTNEILKIKLSKYYTNNQIYQKNSSKNYSNEDIEDNLIGDIYFGAIVNINNELIVGDSLYKIVKDLGVLSVKVKDSTYLYQYLNKDANSKLKNGKSAQQLIDYCDMQKQYQGYTQIDSQITRYISPDIENECNTPFPVAPPVTYVPQLSPAEQLQNEIEKLAVCDGLRDTSWFQSLFGTNRSCINYLDSRRRVKTEYYNQTWGIYSSIGVQVRVQVRTLGVWWASDADEIHLGINRVLLRYNYPQPEIFTYNPAVSDPQPPIYMYNNNYQLLNDNGNYSIVNLSSGTGLPFFTFNNDNILNIYIRQLPDQNYQLNSESNIKQLYKLGIKFLQRNLNSGAKQEFVVTHQKNVNEIETVYFGERYSNKNTNQIQRVFDKQVLDFLIGYSTNANSSPPTSNNPTGSTASSSFSLKIDQGANFRNYTYYELDFFGLAKQGNNWAGNRMNKI